jgi:hypothetical protein
VTRDEEQCSDLIESFHPEEKHGKHVRQLLMQESFE